MKIKFRENIYYLNNEPYVYGARFMASMQKGEYTYDEIIADTEYSENITIMNDEGEIIGIYTGFTTRIAITIMSDIQIELENANIQAQIDGLTQSVDTLNAKVKELTPYVDSQKAYFGESEKTFYNVPEGNISVFFDNYNGDYSINRVSDRVTVSFDPLEQETNITIKVE